MRESSYAHDYSVTGGGPSEEPPGWQVDLAAKPEVPGLWERVEVVFGRVEQLPVLVRYYDRKGRLSRTMQLEEIKKMGGAADPHSDCDLARARGRSAHGIDLFTRGIRRRVGRKSL